MTFYGHPMNGTFVSAHLIQRARAICSMLPPSASPPPRTWAVRRKVLIPTLRLAENLVLIFESSCSIQVGRATTRILQVECCTRILQVLNDAQSNAQGADLPERSLDIGAAEFDSAAILSTLGRPWSSRAQLLHGPAATAQRRPSQAREVCYDTYSA